MEQGEFGGPGKRRRRCSFILGVLAVLLLIVILAVVLGLTLREDSNDLKPTFLNRCQQFQVKNCQHAWEVFQQAYVDKDPCNVSMEAYDPFIEATSFTPSCNRMMFWSKTKDVVHEFTEKKECFQTLEDTVLGSVLDGLTWCGKKGSSETFTTGCPRWTDCINNPVRSFWNRASAAFANVACGNITAMLNGSIATPFDSSSIFASIEVGNLKSDKVNNLNVVLVTQKNVVSNCTNQSFENLKSKLAEGIKFNCKEVPETQIQECGSDPEKACGSCW
ncbi:ADP-ribosyl cyclase/cyclic ADP-ribose hydrolase 1-like [Kryptolebias marmoratus]|uniref:ADP-ribosyl cyclase/cyclic ADP-ribose hydrolase n=1 Tax=Kryptolebias marmoratus TaxID=37003 RepID=A0A3Q3B5J6_KRYMA|nr:ADP-ribosyl cyclase/cyclic ADP-ribose hydrolase 1-like [Kryptolebias marmoratus]